MLSSATLCSGFLIRLRQRLSVKQEMKISSCKTASPGSVRTPVHLPQDKLQHTSCLSGLNTDRCLEMLRGGGEVRIPSFPCRLAWRDRETNTNNQAQAQTRMLQALRRTLLDRRDSSSSTGAAQPAGPGLPHLLRRGWGTCCAQPSQAVGPQPPPAKYVY